MCSRFALRAKLADLQEQFRMFNSNEEFEKKEIFLPTDRIPTINLNEEKKKNQILLMRWGLIPHFIKDFDQVKKYSMFNARSESLEEKPAFRGLLDFNRCLIPADVFYEFKQEGKSKNKYAFTLKSESTFAMAGLWDKWINPKTKEEIFSCTILTTTANEIVRPIHEKNRMPVILEKNNYSEWLNSKIKFNQLVDLLKPFQESQMESEKIFIADTQNKSQKGLMKTKSSHSENIQPSLFGS